MNLPSVTTVLQPYTDFTKINPDVLARAIERGKLVHKVAAALAMDFYFPYPEEHEGYIVSFQNWFKANVKRVIAVEVELVHPTRGYLGHPDLIAEMIEGFIAVIDNKTPVGLQATWGAQCAGYLDLARANGINAEKSGTLRLDPAGGLAKMDWFPGPEGPPLVAFFNALEAWKYFKRR
jgi:hypothetical protein